MQRECGGVRGWAGSFVMRREGCSKASLNFDACVSKRNSSSRDLEDVLGAGGCDGTQAPEQKNKVRETTLSAAHSCLPASISAVRCVRSGSHISPTQQKCRIWKNAAGTTPAANSNNRERAPLIPGVRVGENLLRYDFRFCSARSSLWHSTPPPWQMVPVGN